MTLISRKIIGKRGLSGHCVSFCNIFLPQVLFNLASQYSANEMYAEALNTYQVIVKNKMFINAGRCLQSVCLVSIVLLQCSFMFPPCTVSYNEVTYALKQICIYIEVSCLKILFILKSTQMQIRKYSWYEVYNLIVNKKCVLSLQVE